MADLFRVFTSVLTGICIGMVSLFLFFTLLYHSGAPNFLKSPKLRGGSKLLTNFIEVLTTTMYNRC